MQAIENLSRIEKLRMMEALWDDLSHDAAALTSPAWHGEALRNTEIFLASGQTEFVDWDVAKQHLRDRKA